MAQPQRLNELLSGWQVDPALASMQQTKAAEELTAALRKAEAEYENFTAKGKAARAEATEGFKSASEGMTSLFRGIAALSASSQRDLEKSAQALARFEAVLNVLKGITISVHGSAKAWEAYRAAVLAAASAEAAAARMRASAGAAGTSAQAVGGAGLVTGGGGIILGSATATLGAFVAAVAGAAFGLKVLSEQFDGSAKRLDSWTARIGAAEASAATTLTSNKDRWWYRFMRNDFVTGAATPIRAAEYIAEDSATIQAKTDRLAKAGATRDALAIEQARMAQEAEQRRQFEQGWKDQLRRAERESSAHLAGKGLHGAARDLAQTKDLIASNQTDIERASPQTLVATLNEAISLQKQLESATRAEIQEKLTAARESLNLHKQELQTVQQKMQAMVAERSGAIGVLSTLDPVQARELARVSAKARSGKDISLQESQLLARSNLSEFRPVIETTQMRRVEQLGLGDLVSPLTDAIRQVQQQERTVNAKIELDESITIRLESNSEKQATEIADKVMELLRKKEAAEKKALADAIRKDDEVRRARERSGQRSQT